MVSTLPQTVRLKLEQALAQWRQWHHGPGAEPAPTRVFEEGRSNTSIKVSLEERHWVVRIDGISPSRLGLSRSVEWRALSQAAAAKLAPQPVYQNPELGVLVCEFHPPDTATNNADLESLARLLRDIHALPAVKFRLDPLQRARRYLDLVGGAELAADFLAACERLAQAVAAPALCHNDLLRSNRLLSGGQLLALDWEYAAMGDPMFDIAVIIEGDELDESQAEQLLSLWLQSSPGAEELSHLADHRLVYRQLSSLWERALPHVS